jgi:BolA protein
MSMANTIEEVLRKRLTVAYIEVIDDSRRHAGHAGAASGGGHFIVTIVSSDFAGKSSLERHRMVYDALAANMQGDIHALALTTRAPGEP